MPKRICQADTPEWLRARYDYATSTDAAALLGVHPYKAPIEAYLEKVERADDFIDSERVRWGSLLQDTIAKGIAEQEGLAIRRQGGFFAHDDVARMASSFDFDIIKHERGPGIMEIKNVDGLVFRRTWHVDDDGAIEAPPHIEIQFQHQCEVLNRDWGVIGALVGGNKPVVVYRERDREIGAMIIEAVGQFWACVDDRTPPEPDFARHYDAVLNLTSRRRGGEWLDLSDNDRVVELCRQYALASSAESDARARKKAVRAEIEWIAGDTFDGAFAGGFKISAGTVKEKQIPAHTRAGFRQFRVTEMKAKDDG